MGPVREAHDTWSAIGPEGGSAVAPPVGFEPTHPPPEGGALSPELRGLGKRCKAYRTSHGKR